MLGDLIFLALRIIEAVVNLLIIVIIVNVVISWLVAFDIIRRGNQAVETIWNFTRVITEPLLRPIRRIVPIIGGMDLSPLILILGLSFLVPLLEILLRPVFRVL